MTNDSAPLSDLEQHDQLPHEPQIQILKGNPTDAEVAALIAVLGSAGGGVTEPGPSERNLWAHPADKLRYSVFSWQRVTLLERAHMRR